MRDKFKKNNILRLNKSARQFRKELKERKKGNKDEIMILDKIDLIESNRDLPIPYKTNYGVIITASFLVLLIIAIFAILLNI